MLDTQLASAEILGSHFSGQLWPETILSGAMSNEAGIRLLQSEVVDQIAAGEVVERPAHLVKELVENALDAKATSIEIEYDQGGRKVRVTDDGSGIPAGELALALARHATSKIAAADDLWNLHTFGFRGEALASIGAVSRLTLQSRTKNAKSAHRIVSDFGKLSEVAPSGGNPGTTVIIEELFANVPARLKFMKSETGESAQIKAVLRALALANEKVEFRLKTKGRIDAVWPRAETFLERARQVLGFDRLFESHFEAPDFSADVVFAPPDQVMGNSRSILVFVQKRWVQDRSLQAAVIDAYRGLLMHGEFPIAVVRLTAPPDEVDVNIHPTKSQIKFREPQVAFRTVNRALREALERAPWLERGQPRDAAIVSEAEPRKISLAELTRSYESSASGTTADVSPAVSFASAPVHSVGRFEAPEFDAVVFQQRSFTTQAPTVPSITASTGAWSRLQVIGQSNLTYIVAQDANGVVFVDQHAAHERVAYERLMRAWQSDEGVEVQTLLLPLTIDLEPDGAEALVAISERLENLGIVLDQMGPQSVALRAKPALISDRAIVKALTELAHEINERGGSFVFEKKIGDICATMACHSVVRAGQALSIEQMRSLLAQMDEFPLSGFCPHGRPVSVEYPFNQLERDFGRIV